MGSFLQGGNILACLGTPCGTGGPDCNVYSTGFPAVVTERQKAFLVVRENAFACVLQILSLALWFLGLFRLRIVRDCKATPLLVHTESA